MMFLAQERETAEDAWPGDIIGIPNHGSLRIGDTLTEGEKIQFSGVPSFAPELLRSVNPVDPMRAKHLGRALTQLAEEGVARAFRTRLGSNWIVGVLGALQFDDANYFIKRQAVWAAVGLLGLLVMIASCLPSGDHDHGVRDRSLFAISSASPEPSARMR